MSEDLGGDDQDIKLIKQTYSIDEGERSEKNAFKELYSSTEILADDQYEQINTLIDQQENMERLHGRNSSITHKDADPKQNRPFETNQIVIHTSVSLHNLLSFQDVMKAIEREFHLHDGQEREIIMKLWLKGQTMVSILQRFRHLLQDLNIDDKDFTDGLRKIREVINYAHRDVHYLREKATMLENENHFLEAEFHRQLEKIVHEKNEHISRLISVIDQSCSSLYKLKNSSDYDRTSAANEELFKRFIQQNVELRSEIETLRHRLENACSLANEKLDEKKIEIASSASLIQTAFEQARQAEMKLQELKLQLTSQQEENDLLKCVIEKSQQPSHFEQKQLLSTIEQRSLEREIDRVSRELETTERRTVELEQRFENSDDMVRFQIETLKLNCDIFRKHIETCSRRIDEINSKEYQEEINEENDKYQEDDPQTQGKIVQLENELLNTRERYNELVEHANVLRSELNNLKHLLNEKEKSESTTTIELHQEHLRANQLENELKTIKVKYESECERGNITAKQVEHIKELLAETSRRCERLEKEKSEINAQSESLSRNVKNITTKYKEKLNTAKNRLEISEREKYDLIGRCEQFQNEIDQIKDELINHKGLVLEKEKYIQDVQLKNREILLQKQSIEERISNEIKRTDELAAKNHLLEDELDRLRRSQITSHTNVRQMDNSLLESTKSFDSLKLKVDEFEQLFLKEKAVNESLQVQIKLLEEENIDLREFMAKMRKRSQDDQKNERDRNDEIQQLIARAELNARQYMTHFNLSTLTLPSTVVKILPLSTSTNIT